MLKMKDGRRRKGVRGCEEYLEVDQTEVRLVVDLGDSHLLIRVAWVAGLQVTLLEEH